MRAMILAALLAASTYGLAQKCAEKDPVCDLRATAAMAWMYDRFGASDNDVGMVIEGPESYGPANRLRLERREHEFEEAWARTLQDKSDREAWLGVIEYYEYEAKEAYREWHTHAKRDEQEAYDRHQRECEAAARAAEKRRPLPKPPQAQRGRP